MYEWVSTEVYRATLPDSGSAIRLVKSVLASVKTTINTFQDVNLPVVGYPRSLFWGILFQEIGNRCFPILAAWPKLVLCIALLFD